ncbi:MAG: hypothetical protein JJE09_00620, partial [Bacteroidia bacterium]|nr:hypothetical protein [Bacteroidia bacterium]
LSGNLLDQVRIAYCIPRIISIITVSDGTLINMFPTDLHGAVGEKNYVSSLRKGGLANTQVEKYNKIVISDVDTSFCKQAYALGKNHMHEMTDINAFSTYVERSAKLKLPLPKSVLRYKELSRIDSFDHNIHRIHLYEVIHAQTIESGKSTLAHIHQYYAQWRLDQSFPTQMILR